MTSGTKVAIFLKGYPRLSETFIAQEILGLQRAGLELQLVSLRHPTDTKRHPVHHEITAPVNYLPEYVHDEPMRCLKAWWKVRRMPGYRRARSVWLPLRREIEMDPLFAPNRRRLECSCGANNRQKVTGFLCGLSKRCDFILRSFNNV